MAFDKAALLEKFKGKAKFSEGGDYLKDGVYSKLEIRNIIVDKKMNGFMFIAELTVLESHPTGEVDDAGKARLPHPAGSKPSFVVNLEDKWGFGLGNAIQFVAALEGVDYKSLSSDDALALVMGYAEPDQPARGMLISDTTFNKKTKEKKTDRTNHRWAHVQQTAEEVKARRAAQ